MAIADVLAKTTFTGAFSDADKDSIKAALTTAYNGSATFKAMVDGWLATAGHTLSFNFAANDAYALLNTGKVFVDVAFFDNNSFINNTGEAIHDSLLTGLIHELVHAIDNKADNWNNVSNYKGDTVVKSNTIYVELGLDEQNSYISYDAVGNVLVEGFQYTDGQAIDRSVALDRDWTSAPAGNSNDLLIGGASANRLQGGPGDDVLVGLGGDDVLEGGLDGSDTVLLFGNPTDYDIRLNDDGTWTSIHIRGATNEGTDTFKNLEHVRFAGTNETFNLVEGGLTFQRDIAFVVDQTGSMGDDIAAVKATATAIISALFSGGTIDARIGIVGFRDVNIGEPTTVVLPFTDHATFEAREAAAQAAINTLFASGGGDFPESAFDGLLKALDGSMGDWREGAGTKQIVLFTDATANDAHLLPTVLAYALDIGATISGRSTDALGSFGAVDTFELTFGDAGGRDPSTEDDEFGSSDLIDEPIQPPGQTATIQIFTIFIETFITPDPSFTEISDATGGGVLTAADPAGVIAALLEVIEGGGEPTDPLAQPDLFVIWEDQELNSSVFLDNGYGPDTDSDGPPLQVSHFNGVPVNLTAGSGLGDFPVSLPSGATVQIFEDGTINYTPGPDFDSMPGPDSGATNSVLFDTVTYTLQDGNTVNVVIQVNGVDSADILWGSNGADSLAGGNFDDVLFGLNGADILDGGPGTDTASFAGELGGVFVNLTLGIGASNSAHGDTYISIENVIGSEVGDFIIGTSGVNILDGGDGNDNLIGSLGPDVLIGGAGSDTASYEDNWGTAFVNLMIGKGFNNAAEGDTYQGIENLKGGIFDDFFIGDDGANRIDGALGADTLVGNGGIDTFVFAYAPGQSNPFSHDNVDTLLDFAHGEDLLELSSTAFGGLGEVSADNFVLGTEAADGDDRLIYDQASGTLWFDADGSGDGGAMVVALFTNHAELSPMDFVVA